MTSFQVSFVAPRTGNFYAVCAADEGSRVDPRNGRLTSSITHQLSAIPLLVAKFPIYTATVPALFDSASVNILVYERAGTSASEEDLLLSHDFGRWDSTLGIFIKSDDPSQVSERFFSESTDSRVDNFTLNGSRSGQASVLFDKKANVMYAKINYSSFGSLVTSAALRIVNESLRATTVIQRQLLTSPSAAVQFSLSSQESKNAANSSLYAITLESSNGAVVSIGSPFPGVQLLQAGNPGNVQVTTRATPSRDLRKF